VAALPARRVFQQSQVISDGSHPIAAKRRHQPRLANIV
jgi:hypothetical protein